MADGSTARVQVPDEASVVEGRFPLAAPRSPHTGRPARSCGVDRAGRIVHVPTTRVTQLRALRLRTVVHERIAMERPHGDENVIATAISAVLAMVGYTTATRLATWFNIAVVQGLTDDDVGLEHKKSGRAVLWTGFEAFESEAWIESVAGAIGHELLAWLDDELDLALERAHPQGMRATARDIARQLLLAEAPLGRAILCDAYFPAEYEDGDVTDGSADAHDEALWVKVHDVMPKLAKSASRQMAYERVSHLSDDRAAVHRAMRTVLADAERAA